MVPVYFPTSQARIYIDTTLYLVVLFVFNGRHDIAEILLKVALNTKNQMKSNPCYMIYLNLFITYLHCLI